MVLHQENINTKTSLNDNSQHTDLKLIKAYVVDKANFLLLLYLPTEPAHLEKKWVRKNLVTIQAGKGDPEKPHMPYTGSGTHLQSWPSTKAVALNFSYTSESPGELYKKTRYCVPSPNSDLSNLAAT